MRDFSEALKMQAPGVFNNTVLDKSLWVGNKQFPQVTIAIPAYNEERFIGSVVLQSLLITPNVIVVDDGSRDATVQIAEQAGAIVIKHDYNLGKAAAVNTAFGWARNHHSEILVLIDGDGQHRPNEIENVLEPLINQRADLVVGSRYLSLKSKIPFYRKVGHAGLNAFTNIATGVMVTDTQSGFRAFSRKAIESLHFNGKGLSVESEMQFLAKQHNLVISEVPISVIYQEKAKRNPFSHGMQIITNIIRLIGQHRPLFFFGLPGFVCMILGFFIGISVWDTYHSTHVLATGNALITLLFMVIGILSIFVGIILHTVKAFFQDIQSKLNNIASKHHNSD